LLRVLLRELDRISYSSGARMLGGSGARGAAISRVGLWYGSGTGPGPRTFLTICGLSARRTICPTKIYFEKRLEERGQILDRTPFHNPLCQRVCQPRSKRRLIFKGLPCLANSFRLNVKSKQNNRIAIDANERKSGPAFMSESPKPNFHAA
jgi:hypothetical protein